MEPAYRVEVNRLGFCVRHSLKLYEGKNKLGLTLQTQTRLFAVMEKMKENLSAKQAIKQSDMLIETLDTCVICVAVDRMMDIYYETTARMFMREAEFKAVLISGKGFCVKHYAELLKAAHYAGKRADEFVKDITAAQIKNMKRLFDEMGAFTDKFDASKNKNGSPAISVTDSTSLPRAINKLKGKIL